MLRQWELTKGRNPKIKEDSYEQIRVFQGRAYKRTGVLDVKIEFIKRTPSCVQVDNPGNAIMMHG